MDASDALPVAPPTPPPEAPRRRRRWPWLLLLALLLPLGLVGALLGTVGGRTWLLERGLEAVAPLLDGRLEAEGLDVALGDPLTVRLERAALHRADGKRLVLVEGLEAQLALGPLLHHEVRLPSVSLRHWEVALARTESGLDVAQVVKPQPESKPAPAGPPWSVVLEAISISPGAVSVVAEPDDGAQFALERLGLTGAFSMKPGHVAVKADLKGALVAPRALPATLSVDAESTGFGLDDRLTVRTLELDAGTTKLSAQGRLARREADAKASATLGQELARSLGLKLKRDLSLGATAGWNGTALELHAALDGDAPLLKLDGTLTPAEEPAFTAHLETARLDLAALLEGLPTTSLQGEVQLEGSGITAAALQAAVELSMGEGQVEAVRFASVDVAAQWKGGRGRIARADAAMEGARLSVAGVASLSSLDLTGRAHVGSLQLLLRGLGVRRPWSGRSELKAHVHGALLHPRIDLEGDVTGLANPVLALEVGAIHLGATVPDAAHPTRLDASLRATAGSFQQQRFDRAAADVTLDARKFDGLFSSTGDAALKLHAAGLLPRPAEPLRLDAVDLDLGTEAWRLAAPASIGLENGVRIDGLELRAGEQALHLSGGLKGEQLDLAVQLRGLVLERLPALLIPSSLGLKGVVGGSLTLGGNRHAPTATFRATAAGFGLRGIEGMQLAADGRFVKGRLTATADVEHEGLMLHAEAELEPSLRAPASSPLRLELHAHGLDAARLSTLAGRPDLARGGLDVDASVAGTWAQPTGSLSLVLRALELPRAPPLSGTARLELTPRARLTLSMESLGAQLAAEAEATLPEELLRSSSARAGLVRLPLTAKATLSRVDAIAWRPFLALPAELSGRFGAQLDFQGTVEEPRGTVVVTAEQAGWGRWLGLSGEVALDAQERLKLKAHLDSSGAPLATAEGGLTVALAGLIAHPERLGAHPIQLHVVAAPLDLAHPPGAIAPLGKGIAQGDLTLGGTLDAPEVDLAVDGRGLTLREVAWNEAHLRLHHDANGISFDAAAEKLSAQLRTPLRLGLASLKEGLAWKEAPFTARLKADGFELAPLSGLSSALRTIEGRLVGDVTGSGTLGAPRFEGALALHQGRAVVRGFGDFRQIEAEAQLSNDAWRLPKLELRSAGGTLRFKGEAVRPDAASPFEVTGELRTARFPVRANDQLLASVQTIARLSGQSRANETLLRVDVDELHAELPEASPRSVQSLEPHPDVQVVGREKEAEKAPVAEGETGHVWRIGVHAPGNAWLRGQDVNVDLRAFLGLRFDARGLEMTEPPGLAQPSTVEVLRGKVDVIGRRFDFPEKRPAKLVFEGGPWQRAHLDATVLYVDRADAITVTVGITGPLLHPNPPTLTSEPPYDSSQLALLIATGHLEAKRGSGSVSSSTGVASIVGALVASELQKGLSAKLPLDTLSIESAGDGAARIQAGVYVTDTIYVGYTHNVTTGTSTSDQTTQNANEVSIQYRLTQRWQLEAVGGDRGAGGVDAVWTNDY